jgi:hypothetical protein
MGTTARAATTERRDIRPAGTSPHADHSGLRRPPLRSQACGAWGHPDEQLAWSAGQESAEAFEVPLDLLGPSLRDGPGGACAKRRPESLNSRHLATSSEEAFDARRDRQDHGPWGRGKSTTGAPLPMSRVEQATPLVFLGVARLI